MFASAPSAPTIGLILGAWLVLAVRLNGFHATAFDRRFNIGLGTVAAAATIRIPVMQAALAASTGWGIPEGLLCQFGAAAAANFGAAAALRMWQTATYRGLSVTLTYGLASASTVGAMIGAAATDPGDPRAIDDQTGWAQFGYWACIVPMNYWMAIAGLSVCLREGRRLTDRRERVLHLMVAVLIGTAAIGIGIMFAGSLLRATDHPNSLTSSVDSTGFTIQLLSFVGVGAVPVLAALPSRIGLDTWSRRRKQLLPLWTELTNACPEVVHHTVGSPGGSRYLLHRTVIEIRDCALILARYGRTSHGAITIAIARAAPAGPDRDALHVAVRLADACAARAGGDQPAGTGTITLPATSNLRDEADELAAIAQQWSVANALLAAPGAKPESAV
ncbi:MAB_1171c family putative transporter [Nocardia sp. NPDC052566]|uniref:MAB_1171c family putative transporter n=1 Tax=Nocardia sp. NPDC052566 TaxID=3364330 RepID=UPI0037CC4F6E